jgi:hypothetical protein
MVGFRELEPLRSKARDVIRRDGNVRPLQTAVNREECVPASDGIRPFSESEMNDPHFSLKAPWSTQRGFLMRGRELL